MSSLIHLVARCAGGHETRFLVQRDGPIMPEYADLLRALLERASETEGGCRIPRSEGGDPCGAAVAVEVEP